MSASMMTTQACLGGEICAHTTAEVDIVVDDAVASGAAVVEIDVSGVTAMDAAGVELLGRRSHELARANRLLRLVHPSDPVVRIVKAHGLSRRLFD